MRPSMKAARGYDLYGNIAVIDAVPSFAKRIGTRLMHENKNVKTVLRKGGAVSGRYRTRRFLYVLGERNYVATYRENNCIFRFDIRKTYFSTRLAYERKRVVDSVHDGEKVIVMFAGVGPYAIEIAKTHKKTELVAIELNRNAYNYLLENIVLNKTQNVTAELGSVDEFAEKYRGFADRIIMPLPKDAYRFLPTALKMSQSKCVINFYAFYPIDQIKQKVEETRKLIEMSGREWRCKLVTHRIARPYSSSEAEVAVDFIVHQKDYNLILR